MMDKKYQNGFFIFGIIVLALMLTGLDYTEVWNGLKRAGYWFFAVVALWAALYVINTAAWYIIIRQGASHNTADTSEDCPAAGVLPVASKRKDSVPFWWLYKVTVSGFALNYATPGGLMGGEAYRIMELSPRIGKERATSSVILYVMTHIFSHFWFWLISTLLFAIMRPLTLPLVVLLLLVSVFCLAGIWFFMRGYRKGLALSLARILSHLPWIGRRAGRMIDQHREQLEQVDRQIAALHKQNPRTFVSAVGLELLCRLLSSFEIMFVLLVVMPDVSYISCVIMLAFTSLFANLLFFIPLQLGGREGGFMMSASGLAMTASSGIFVALIVRIRELIWTAIGLLLIKLEKKQTVKH